MTEQEIQLTVAARRAAAWQQAANLSHAKFDGADAQFIVDLIVRLDNLIEKWASDQRKKMRKNENLQPTVKE